MANHAKLRCPSCGSLSIDTATGESDFTTCNRCGDEWEMHLLDWVLTPSQMEALRILIERTETRGRYAAWATTKNDSETAAVAQGSVAVLAASHLAEPGWPGYWMVTDLGRKVYEAMQP